MNLTIVLDFEFELIAFSPLEHYNNFKTKQEKNRMVIMSKNAQLVSAFSKFLFNLLTLANCKGIARYIHFETEREKNTKNMVLLKNSQKQIN